MRRGDGVPAVLGLGRVVWHQAPLAFELSSSDAALLARAGTIFRPWSAGRPVEPSHRWRVEPVRDPERGTPESWEIRGDPGSDVLVRATSAKALLTVEFLAVQALFDHGPGLLTLHGALVAKGDRGVIVLGRGEAGKSTLACALWQRGWAFLCDDAALVDPETGHARPTPRRVSLRRASRDLLGEALWTRIETSPSYDRTVEGCVFHPEDVDRRARPASTRLVAAVFLDRRGSAPAPARLTALEPAHALLALLPYSNLARRLDPGEVIRRLRPLVEAVPAYDLGRGPLGEMARALETLETLVEGDA